MTDPNFTIYTKYTNLQNEIVHQWLQCHKSFYVTK